MGTTAEILLVIMLLLLGTTLVIIGVQIFFVLKDFRQNMQKINKILTDWETISASVASGTSQVSELMEKLRGAMSLALIGRKVWEIVKGGKEESVEPED